MIALAFATLSFSPTAMRVAHTTRPVSPSFPRAGTTSMMSSSLLLADALTTAAADVPDWQQTVQQFQDSHAFLIGIVTTIIIRLLISELRARFEKPVMDNLSEKATTELTPDTNRLELGQWGQLVLCLALDLAGDASELLPILGEFTDIAYAPVEAGLIKLLFQSNALAAFGFVEEILPFTDVVPTFTISWALKNLWPTTPLARRLLPQEK
jgi:hypothetical protein